MELDAATDELAAAIELVATEELIAGDEVDVAGRLAEAATVVSLETEDWTTKPSA